MKNNVKIEVCSDSSCYVTINGMVFYIEHSDVAPMHVSCWEDDSSSADVTYLTKENK